MKNIYVLNFKDMADTSKIVSGLVSEYGFKIAKTYTTRPKKYTNEDRYVFVNDEIFDAKNFISSVSIDGYKYGVTKSEVDICDIFPCEMELGLDFFKKYDGNKDLYVLYKCDADDIQNVYDTWEAYSSDNIGLITSQGTSAYEYYEYICEKEGIKGDMF